MTFDHRHPPPCRGRDNRLERAVPETEIDVCLARFDAMLARAAHDLRRRVEAHRLRIEQRSGKRRRVMAFDPGRDIDEMGEAGSMALGEAIFAKALDLIEAALGELGRIAARRHAADHLLMQGVDGAAAAEGRHGAAQLVRPRAAVNFAATMASRIACSWNSGTPIVLPST